MQSNLFIFKQFVIWQDKCAFRVGTDAVLLGAVADVAWKKRILDIGTGTGLIALMMAQRSRAEVYAIEPDNDSFTQATENIRRSRWAGRIRVENCRLQDFFPENIKFDLIVSNPPFFIDSLKNPDPAKSNSRHNENLTHKDLLEGAARLLDNKGNLQIILPRDEGTLFEEQAVNYGFYCSNIMKIKPLPASEIKRLIMIFSRIKKKPSESYLTIGKDIRHNFTEEYIHLTKDFYVKF